MNKINSYVLASVVAVGMLLSGCGGNKRLYQEVSSTSISSEDNNSTEFLGKTSIQEAK